MLELLRKEREIVQAMRGLGILQDVKGHRLDLGRGVILCGCADGDQFYDIFTHQVRIHTNQRTDPRIHMLAWNGGPLLLAGGKDPGYDEDARFGLKQIQQAHELKEIETLILEGHVKCGIAHARGLDPITVGKLFIIAKARVKKMISKAVIPIFCQVDWGGNKKNTYFFSEDYFEKHISDLEELAAA